MKFNKSREAMAYKEMRTRFGLSSTELAGLLGVTRETISRREAGTTPLTMEACLAMQYICEEMFLVHWSHSEAEKRQNEN